MTAHLTVAEARALGLDPSAGTGARPPSGARRRSTRKAVDAAECAPNRCVTCGETFGGEKAEARHLKQTGHARYETVL